MIDYLNFIIESRNVQTLEIKNTNVYILAGGTKRVDRISKIIFWINLDMNIVSILLMLKN